MFELFDIVEIKKRYFFKRGVPKYIGNYHILDINNDIDTSNGAIKTQVLNFSYDRYNPVKVYYKSIDLYNIYKYFEDNNRTSNSDFFNRTIYIVFSIENTDTEVLNMGLIKLKINKYGYIKTKEIRTV